MDACAMVAACRRHQVGPALVITGPVCRYCRHEAATEVANGEPACWTCANEIAVERLMRKHATP
jgi:hypothetical protein